MIGLDEFLKVSDEIKHETCEKHGVYESKNIFGKRWSSCVACAKELAEVKAEEAEEKKRLDALLAWQHKIKRAGIPDRFNNRSLTNFNATTPEQIRALEFAKQYATKFDDVLETGRSAIFMGLPGTGKTHLAIGIARHIMHYDKRTALFTTVMRAIRSIKSTWDKSNHESETHAIAALTEPDLLILDEVGVQFGSETEKLLMFDVLNERYENRRPTLLLTNLSLDDVKSFLGERVFDRLREDGGEAVPFNWESYRGRMERAA